MITVAALTSGKNVPSSRFRIRQHIEPLRRHDIDVREQIPWIDKYATSRWQTRPWARAANSMLVVSKLASRIPGILASRGADVTWLERELLPGRRSLERALGAPLVWDVDDGIWLFSARAERAARATAAQADAMIVVNDYVASRFEAHPNLHVVPTAIDTERWIPRPRAARDDFVLGWTGVSTNYGYLYAIEDALAPSLQASPRTRLLVVADAAPRFTRLPPDRVDFVRWDPDNESTVVDRMDVGLMPLPDDEWAKAKGSFKMLQYMSSGIPVVVSPVGMNLEVLSLDEVGFGPRDSDAWIDAIATLRADPQLRATMGKKGRAVVEQRFSLAAVTPSIAAALRSVV